MRKEKERTHHHIRRREEASRMESVSIPGPEYDPADRLPHDPENFLRNGKFAPGNTVAEKPVNWETVTALGKIGATGEEVAAALEINANTLNDQCKRVHGVTFQEWYKRIKASFQISLRRAQARQAFGQLSTRKVTRVLRDGTRETREEEFYLIHPSTTMLIFLGKQELGQRDVVEWKHRAEEPGEPVDGYDWELSEIVEQPGERLLTPGSIEDAEILPADTQQQQQQKIP